MCCVIFTIRNWDYIFTMTPLVRHDVSNYRQGDYLFIHLFIIPVETYPKTYRGPLDLFQTHTHTQKPVIWKVFPCRNVAMRSTRKHIAIERLNCWIIMIIIIVMIMITICTARFQAHKEIYGGFYIFWMTCFLLMTIVSVQKLCDIYIYIYIYICSSLWVLFSLVYQLCLALGW